MSNLIAKLDSNEYKAFCLYLRKCCGMTISELIKLPHTRQNNAYFQFKEEQGEKQSLVLLSNFKDINRQ